MKVLCNQRTDTLTAVLQEDSVVGKSDERKPSIILDFDGAGNLPRLEILDASQRVMDAGRIEYQFLG